MSNSSLTNGTILSQPWANDTGMLLGTFTRQGQKWWTVYWIEAGTLAHTEKDILQSMDIVE